jgi:hypothetical protein
VSPISRHIAAIAVVLADAPSALADATIGKAVGFGGLLATALQCRLIREGEGAR